MSHMTKCDRAFSRCQCDALEMTEERDEVMAELAALRERAEKAEAELTRTHADYAPNIHQATRVRDEAIARAEKAERERDEARGALVMAREKDERRTLRAEVSRLTAERDALLAAASDTPHAALSDAAARPESDRDARDLRIAEAAFEAGWSARDRNLRGGKDIDAAKAASLTTIIRGVS